MLNRATSSPSHGENRGSSPLGSANTINHLIQVHQLVSNNCPINVYGQAWTACRLDGHDADLKPSRVTDLRSRFRSVRWKGRPLGWAVKSDITLFPPRATSLPPRATSRPCRTVWIPFPCRDGPASDRGWRRARRLCARRVPNVCAMPQRLSALSRPSPAPSNGGLVVTSSALTVRHRDLIIALAARYRRPRCISHATLSLAVV